MEGGLDERGVRDRPRHRLHCVRAAPHDDSPDALAALAVTDDLERELAQHGVHRLAEPQLGFGLGLDAQAGGAVGERKYRVARRQLPVDRDAVERTLNGHPG